MSACIFCRHSPAYRYAVTVHRGEFWARFVEPVCARCHALLAEAGAGTPVDGADFLRRIFRPMLARAGLPRIRFHDLRHTAASLMLSGGVDVRTVAATLGHSKPAITLNTYAHLMTGQREKAAAVMDAALAASG